jgi:hypothetical protein
MPVYSETWVIEARTRKWVLTMLSTETKLRDCHLQEQREIAERWKEVENRKATKFMYRLTVRAKSHHHQIPTIKGYIKRLRAASGWALPQNIANVIERWEDE